MKATIAGLALSLSLSLSFSLSHTHTHTDTHTRHDNEPPLKLWQLKYTCTVQTHRVLWILIGFHANVSSLIFMCVCLYVCVCVCVCVCYREPTLNLHDKSEQTSFRVSSGRKNEWAAQQTERWRSILRQRQPHAVISITVTEWVLHKQPIIFFSNRSKRTRCEFSVCWSQTHRAFEKIFLKILNNFQN